MTVSADESTMAQSRATARITRVRRATVSCVVMLAAVGCATTQFDRYLAQQRWADAATAFAADSSLHNDPRALYQAAVLYDSPDRPTYDPARARELFGQLLARFPASAYRADAASRLALLEQLLNGRADAAARERDLEARIAALANQVRQLHTQLESASAQSDSLRRGTGRLQSDLRERDEQLRALRLELERLKAIDLRRRPPLAPVPAP
jgi:hypothetical protein